ncbi:interferon-inducible GTPase 5-like [Mercenaria mercenaria]|uniref:interferon-inducible GTPase 5-like n=1 Tax=Mercenaria mercenaria TaxID=6596 RepID=UPI00234E3870|nr:interferon-inducible GTPase 5-like [Mercenaria mercenaria]XP_045197026.2 interferon-inducible GTPase 5-like [Mercenaria mercenaria]XP_053381042.1 interferon-inducible GTPase 5-like [Mercenaria mercenaria]
MAMAESYPGRSSLTSFIEKLGGKIRNEFNLEGTNGVVMFVKNNVEKWKSIPINLAVIGETGVGKSTFINTIRNLLDDDEGSALVGVIQTTKIPTPYNHPENENLKIWDLPGFGTADFPKSTYMKNIEAEKFGFFLILSSSRFKLDDVWLAKEIKKTNKTFFFVRTMVDRNIKDVNGRRTNKIPETKLLDDISKECRAVLRSGGFDDADIGLFLIDSHTPNRYEFGKLGRELINAAPEKKRDALTLSITTLTSEMIEEKKILLEKRIWYFAVSSGVVGGIPIPGLGVVFDAALLVEEAIRYRNQFGLNEKGLQKVAKWLKKTS